MELLLDKAIGFSAALFGALTSLVIWLFKRSDYKIDKVMEDLAQYKEQQARESESHRIRYNSEMSELKAELKGVTTALYYININLNHIQKSVDNLAEDIRK